MLAKVGDESSEDAMEKGFSREREEGISYVH